MLLSNFIVHTVNVIRQQVLLYLSVFARPVVRGLLIMAVAFTSFQILDIFPQNQILLVPMGLVSTLFIGSLLPF